MNDKEGLKVLHELFKFYYYKKNGLIFVSAGNDGTVKPWDDCVYLNTVAALQETKATKAGEQPPLKAVDSKATGGGWAASSGKHVDFAAPGLDIAVTNPDGTSTALGGSSFAAPLVAGLAALIISINPRLTNKQVESILVSSCRGVSGRNQQFGFGMPDAEKAVKLAKSM